MIRPLLKTKKSDFFNVNGQSRELIGVHVFNKGVLRDRCNLRFFNQFVLLEFVYSSKDNFEGMVQLENGFIGVVCVCKTGCQI